MQCWLKQYSKQGKANEHDELEVLAKANIAIRVSTMDTGASCKESIIPTKIERLIDHIDPYLQNRDVPAASMEFSGVAAHLAN